MHHRKALGRVFWIVLSPQAHTSQTSCACRKVREVRQSSPGQQCCKSSGPSSGLVLCSAWCFQPPSQPPAKGLTPDSKDISIFLIPTPGLLISRSQVTKGSFRVLCLFPFPWIPSCQGVKTPSLRTREVLTASLCQNHPSHLCLDRLPPVLSPRTQSSPGPDRGVTPPPEAGVLRKPA